MHKNIETPGRILHQGPRRRRHGTQSQDTFQSNPENPYVPRKRNREELLNANGEEEPARGLDGRIVSQPKGPILKDGFHYGDLKLVSTFPGETHKAIIINVTVLGLHVGLQPQANHQRGQILIRISRTWHRHQRSGTLALRSRWKCHRIWTGFHGGISKAATDITNHINAKGQAEHLRGWERR